MTEAAQDAANVGTAKGNPGGYAWVAPAGTALPTDAKMQLDPAFKPLGYISEDGVTNSTDTDTEDLKDWSGGVIKSPQTSYSETFQVGFLESRADVLKVVYGDKNVTDDGKGGITVKHNGAFSEERVYVFESLVTDTLIMRTVIPRGSVTERDDVTQNASDALTYTPTIKALKDAAGNSAYTYYYDSAKKVD